MSSYEDILAHLYEILKEKMDIDSDIEEETDLVADLGLDSLKAMNIVLAVEDRFDISIPLNVLPDVRTIRDFAQQVEQLMNE